MKVLMFGWEFPPFISGGLGTACFGITKGLIANDVDVTFVLPTKKGNKIPGSIKVIGADEVPLVGDIETLTDRLKIINIETAMSISPYRTVELVNEFFRKHLTDKKIEHVTGSLLEFTGNYGKNLLHEVLNCSLIAESLVVLETFDIIHAHDWLTFPAGVRAKMISGKPLVVHVHATEFDRSGENVNQDVYHIEKYGLLQSDKIIAVSYYTKNMIVQHYGIHPDKIEVIHNAVDKQKQFSRYQIKKNLDEKIVLFLGRVTMQKGPDYFIEAASRVLKKIKNVRFVMAGSGDMLPRMIYRMAELRMADRFHFTGFLKGTEVEKMYALSDLYVMPSVSEPFGLTAFEALVYDIPIIISKQSGASEILKNAVSVDFWDVEKLANMMVMILENDVLSKSIVDRCSDEIKSIDWRNAALKLKVLYHSVLR